MKRSDKLLKGIREIGNFLDTSDAVVYDLIEKGLPVFFVEKAREKYWAVTYEVEAWLATQSEPIKNPCQDY